MDPLLIDGESLTIENVHEVAFDRRRVALQRIDLHQQHVFGRRGPEQRKNRWVAKVAAVPIRHAVSRGLALTAIALALGVPAAIGLGRLARGVLFGVEPSDPLTLTGAALLLASVSLAACYVPARRAMRVDPMVALRYE